MSTETERIIWELRPTQGEWTTSTWHVWETACGTYRVMRLIAKFTAPGEPNPPEFAACVKRGASWETCDTATVRGVTRPRYYPSLSAALEAVEQYHQRVTGADHVASNRDKVMDWATKNGLSGKNVSPTTLQQKCRENEKEQVMKVKLSAVVSMFAEMGFTGTDKGPWLDPVRVLAKVKGLPKLIASDDTRPSSETAKVMLEKLLKALSDGDEIEITDDTPAGEKAKVEPQPAAAAPQKSAAQATTKGKPAAKGGKASAGDKGKGGGKDKPKPTEKKPVGENKFSCLDAAAKVLGEKGKPMTAPELIEVMAAKGYWTSPGGKTPAATLYAGIVVEINKKGKDSRFKKVDKGTFDLR